MFTDYRKKSFTYLPVLVMIISVPSSWNLSQSSLFSRWHSTLASSSQLLLFLSKCAYGLLLPPDLELLDEGEEVEEELRSLLFCFGDIISFEAAEDDVDESAGEGDRGESTTTEGVIEPDELLCDEDCCGVAALDTTTSSGLDVRPLSIVLMRAAGVADLEK